MSRPGYTVKTQDVDGSSSRRFKTLAAAVRRFESMAGIKVDSAIAEHYAPLAEQGGKLPAIDEVQRLRAVSMFGTVVTLRRDERIEIEDCA